MCGTCSHMGFLACDHPEGNVLMGVQCVNETSYTQIVSPSPCMWHFFCLFQILVYLMDQILQGKMEHVHQLQTVSQQSLAFSDC